MPTHDPTPSDEDDRRCRRGEHCALRTLTRDPDGEATGWEAVLLADPTRIWCDPCRGRLFRALHTIPGLTTDICADLTVETRISARYDTASTPGQLDHSPVPLNLTADALLRLLDHELTTWADEVAARAGLVATGEWATTRVAPGTPDPTTVALLRVRQGCQLLAFRLGEWITAPALTYQARSLTADPRTGHTAPTASGGDWWCTRTGEDGALTVLDLFRTIERVDAARPRDPNRPERVREACPHCHTRRVYRHHNLAVYWCHACSKQWHEDTHITVLDTLLAQKTPPADALAAAG